MPNSTDRITESSVRAQTDAHGGRPGRQRRVLLLTSNFPRWKGDSTTPFILHLAQDLQDVGWVVDVLAPAAPGAKATERLDGVNTVRFRYMWPERTQTVFYEGGALANLGKRPREKLKLPILVTAECISTLRQLIRNRYDLLSSHWILPQGFVGAVASRPSRTPHVTSVHGSDVFGLKGRHLVPFKKAALRWSDAVTVNSSATARAVEELVGYSVRPRLIPMGANVDEPDAKVAGRIRSRYRSGTGPLLVFVGRLVAQKGVIDLVEALAILTRTHPDASVLIIGEGPCRIELKQLARDRDLVDKVHFAGWVQPADVVSYMAAGDVVVGPSKEGPTGEVEGFGLTMVEAMASGTPLVATRSGGIPDVVIDGETGVLVPPGSPVSIAAAIVDLLNNHDRTARITRAAQDRARTKFSRHTSAAAYSKLFEEVLGTHIIGDR